jgi:hypothetical protein
MLSRYRRVGDRERKLHYLEVSNTQNPFAVRSFMHDEEDRCWMLDYKLRVSSRHWWK